MAKNIITIYRTRTFFNESQDKLDDYLANSKQSIGSNWASSQSKQIGTGLTAGEINLLLPHLIDLEPGDRDFKKGVKDFYMAIHTNVDYETGVELDVTIDDESKPLSESNLPHNILDYVKYKHALQHPEVAHSKDVATGNQLYKFYVHNPTAVKKKSVDVRQKRDEALAEYLKLTKEKNEEKIDNVLLMFGEDTRTFADKDAKLEFLSQKANASDVETLNDFITKATDSKLELKGLLNKAVNFEILKMAGMRYLYKENGNVLAHSTEEAILELEENPDTLTALKALIQDKVKASKSK